jgi:K+-sensing histidine kinase KdpD
MANENKVIFYSEELNEDIYQNNKLLSSKKIILENNEKEQITQNSYNTIVDSKDYLGCINNNCSTIKYDCANNKNNFNHSINTIKTTSKAEGTINDYITKLIDFLFILLLVGLLIYIIFKRESLYLIYVLGITLVYIFMKIIMLGNL